MYVHLGPNIEYKYTISLSSASVQGEKFNDGSSLLMNLSLTCLHDRPGITKINILIIYIAKFYAIICHVLYIPSIMLDLLPNSTFSLFAILSRAVFYTFSCIMICSSLLGVSLFLPNFLYIS